MTQKTNQFNLTTFRYSEGDIIRFIEKGDLVITVNVKDKFGDNGITGLIIIELEGSVAKINSLLLSCRILGKGIEFAFISYSLNKLKKFGIKKVQAKYIATQKNSQVKDFYEKVGFKNTGVSKDKLSTSKEFVILLKDFNYDENNIYKIEEN